MRMWLAGGAALLMALSVNAQDDVLAGGSADDALFAEMPMVLTASRLKQPQAEVPAAVTLIDRELIRLSGARTLPEVLRLVPGMLVGYRYGHTATVGYHGLVEENAHRMQVLIDGRSVFEPALARILWNDIPLALDDVQRIEVTRGPNSALYGANSFFAIVNIITRHPVDAAGTTLTVSQGDKQIRDTLLRHGGHTEAGSDYRLTVGTRADDGFDINEEGDKQYDGYDSAFINAAWQQQTADGDRLSAQFGFKRGDKEITELDPYESAPYHNVDDDNAYLQASWTSDLSPSHERRLQAYINYNDTEEEWDSCPPGVFLSNELGALFNADEAYTLALLEAYSNGDPLPPPPSAEIAALLPPIFARIAGGGLAPVCGLANQNLLETRADIELQDTLTLSDRLRVVAGLSARADRVKSETYFGGKRSSDLLRAFANAEWRWRDDVLLHAGAMLEHDDIVGTELSPRLAVNWAINDQHSVRAIIARAVRTPDLFEEYGRFSYRLRELQSPVNGSESDALFFQHSESAGGLAPERILSRELGLYARYLDNRLELDLKLFNDSLSNLVEGQTQLYGFSLDNGGHADQRGAELQINYRPSSAWRVMAASSLLELSHTSIGRYERASAKHSSQALIGYRLPTDTELSLTWYELDDFWDRDYRLLGARIGHEFNVGKRTRLGVALVLQSRRDRGYFFDEDNNESDYNYGWINASLSF
ncbi:TonB-dependent receptor [Permianibacter sp. IMCC34836]|uniref:TonB-dependent receptor plug domain-containing protein n=1 Tax=Permianibacter fluminis TaxID=2738515 RepID=UPI001557F7B1|nr:TonB-dependent receptor [Permianibacter fluminis]NQD39015.1 TonB-dependent receptor [Permianibacter fluminis]